jgi:hypothetical protein
MHRLRPYLQLVRLPNVFTALADIALAARGKRSTRPTRHASATAVK